MSISRETGRGGREKVADRSAPGTERAGIARALRYTCLWGSAFAPGHRTSRNTAGRSPCRSPRTARSSPWCWGSTVRRVSGTPINATPPPPACLRALHARSVSSLESCPTVPTSAKRRRATYLVSYDQETSGRGRVLSRDTSNAARAISNLRRNCTPTVFSRSRAQPDVRLSRFNCRRCEQSAVCISASSILTFPTRSTFFWQNVYDIYLLFIIYFSSVILWLFVRNYSYPISPPFRCAYVWKTLCQSIIFFSLSLFFHYSKKYFFFLLLKVQNEQLRMREYSNVSSARHLIWNSSRIESDSIRVRIIDHVSDSIVPFNLASRHLDLIVQIFQK